MFIYQLICLLHFVSFPCCVFCAAVDILALIDSSCSFAVVKKKASHRCNAFCLGPLTFHCQALGDMVSLSHGGQVAARKGATFKNGLVFSCRLVVIEEKICLRVNGHSPIWHGALRLGFTSVHPVSRSLPLPPMAIPDLSETPDYWATPVHESYCLTGSELQFWVSSQGMICTRTSSCKKLELLKGVDVSKPLWAMIDIYGQTLSISLLGQFTLYKQKTFLLCSVFIALS